MCRYSPSGNEDEVAFTEHTDTTLITLALCSPVAGLQVQSRGEWVSSEKDRNTCEMLVLAGEFLELLTKGYLRAAPHRVLRPCGSARCSIPFLIRAKPRALMNTQEEVQLALKQKGGSKVPKGLPGPNNILLIENKTLQSVWTYANGW